MSVPCPSLTCCDPQLFGYNFASGRTYENGGKSFIIPCEPGFVCAPIDPVTPPPVIWQPPIPDPTGMVLRLGKCDGTEAVRVLAPGFTQADYDAAVESILEEVLFALAICIGRQRQDPRKKLKLNTEQSCTYVCPNGSTHTETVAAGTFTGKTQATADKRAHDYACQQAKAKASCAAVGLMAYWSMDQTSLSFGVLTLLDSTSNAINLFTSVGGWTLVPGKIAQALALDNGGFADTSGAAITAITNPGDGFTFCGWFKSGFGAADIGNIWEFDWQGAPGYYFILEINNGGILTLRTNHSPDFSEIDISYPLDGDWHFYRLGIDPGDHKMKLQLDNGTINESGPITFVPTAASSFHLGTASFIPDTPRLYDEMGIWNRWLSDSEAAFVYNGGAARTFPNLP